MAVMHLKGSKSSKPVDATLLGRSFSAPSMRPNFEKMMAAKSRIRPPAMRLEVLEEVADHKDGHEEREYAAGHGFLLNA